MPEQEQPQQFQINFRCDPDKLVLRIPTSPITAQEIILPEEIMSQIAGQWLETRKQLKRDLQLIADINATKIRENMKLIRP